VSRVRVIGIGSPAGEDQAGWRVVDALRSSGVLDQLPRAVDTVSLDRPGARLVHHLAGADTVILIDAIKSGSAPGTIHRIDDIARLDGDRALSSHGFGLAAALGLAHALGGLPASLILYGVEIENHAIGSGLSAAVEKAVVTLTCAIGAELQALVQNEERALLPRV
jgi:hydrogenase maturation protease